MFALAKILGVCKVLPLGIGNTRRSKSGLDGDKMGENDIGGESGSLPKTFFHCNGKNVGVGTSPARLCEKWDPVFWDEEWDLGKRMRMDISWISREMCLVKGRVWHADRSGCASERMR